MSSQKRSESVALVSLAPVKPRPLCPVCGKPSYSQAGIHPQCSAVAWDRKWMEKARAAAALAPAEAAKPSQSLAVKAWHRRCPKCNGQSHIRKATCACGHEFDKGTSSMRGE